MNQPDNLTGPHLPAITTTEGVDGTAAVEALIAAAGVTPSGPPHSPNGAPESTTTSLAKLGALPISARQSGSPSNRSPPNSGCRNQRSPSSKAETPTWSKHLPDSSQPPAADSGSSPNTTTPPQSSNSPTAQQTNPPTSSRPRSAGYSRTNEDRPSSATRKSHRPGA